MSIAGRFGENLRRARKDADLSQEEVGIRASLHRRSGCLSAANASRGSTPRSSWRGRSTFR